MHDRREVCELLEMERRKPFEPVLGLDGESQTHHAMIVGVTDAVHEAGGVGTVDEPDRAVVLEEQVVGDVTDGGSAVARVAFHRQQKLVLRRRQPGRLRLVFGPCEETAKAAAQLEETPELCIGDTGAASPRRGLTSHGSPPRDAGAAPHGGGARDAAPRRGGAAGR